MFASRCYFIGPLSLAVCTM